MHVEFKFHQNPEFYSFNTVKLFHQAKLFIPVFGETIFFVSKKIVSFVEFELISGFEENKNKQKMPKKVSSRKLQKADEVKLYYSRTY